MKCERQTKREINIATTITVDGGYVVTTLSLLNKKSTTPHALRIQAWCLLAQSGAVLQRSKHDRLRK